MFKNKNILITGASKGLGREISVEFKKLGANLILVARDKKILKGIVKKNDKKHMIFDCDLFDPKNIDIICEYIKKKLKKIDIIVHCLGGSFGINDPMENWHQFQKSIYGNLGNAIEFNSQLIPLMIKKGKGNIIHVSSITGLEAIGSVPYVTSKAAISGYVRSMGNHLSEFGITLCGIVPGAFFGFKNSMSRFKFYKPEEFKKFSKKLPNSRMPKAKEYLDFIKLVSKKESKIFSGSLVSLDTGQGKTVLQNYIDE